MKKIRVKEFIVDPQPVITTRQFKVKIKIDEIESLYYARQSGGTDIEIYAGESVGRI